MPCAVCGQDYGVTHTWTANAAEHKLGLCSAMGFARFAVFDGAGVGADLDLLADRFVARPS